MYAVTAPTSSQNAAGRAVVGEQRPALQPRGELGLQVEPEPERRVAEDVVDDAQLVEGRRRAADAARRARSVIVPCSRRSAHSSAALSYGRRRVDVAHPHAEAATDDVEQPRGLALERPVRPPRRRRWAPRALQEPLGHALGELGAREPVVLNTCGEGVASRA